MRYTAAALLFVSAAFLLAAAALDNTFSGDDFIWLYDGHQTSSLADVFRLHDVPFAHYDGVRLDPTVNAFFSVGWRAFGANPIGYHAIMVGVCAATASLVAVWLSQLGLPWEIALTGGLTFLVYPWHAEPMIWLSASGEAWVGLFTMVALTCFVRWRRGAGRLWCGLFVGAMAAALLAKESAFVLPIVLLMADTLVLSAPMDGFRLRRHFVPFALGAIVLMWKVVTFLRARADIVAHPLYYGWSDALTGNHHYLLGTLLGYAMALRLGSARWFEVAVLMLFCGMLAWTWMRGHRRATLHLAWLLLAVQPYVWLQADRGLYERYTWQPSIPLSCLVGLGFWWLLRNTRGIGRAILLPGFLICLACSGKALHARIMREYIPNDMPALKSQIDAALQDVPPDSDLYVYNRLDFECAGGRAVALLGGVSADRIHNWYDVLQQTRLDAGARFIFWDPSSRSVVDVTDSAVLDYSALKGRLGRDDSPRHAATTAFSWDFRRAADRRRWSAHRLTWNGDVLRTPGNIGRLCSPHLSLSPFALYAVELTFVPRDGNPQPCIGWSPDRRAVPDPDRTACADDALQDGGGAITDYYHLPSYVTWWTGGPVQSLCIVPSTAPASLELRALRIYTFGATR